VRIVAAEAELFVPGIKQLDEFMDECNNRQIHEFEGYSPVEMHHILHFAFSNKSPVQLQKLEDSD